MHIVRRAERIVQEGGTLQENEIHGRRRPCRQFGVLQQGVNKQEQFRCHRCHRHPLLRSLAAAEHLRAPGEHLDRTNCLLGEPASQKGALKLNGAAAGEAAAIQQANESATDDHKGRNVVRELPRNRSCKTQALFGASVRECELCEELLLREGPAHIFVKEVRSKIEEGVRCPQRRHLHATARAEALAGRDTRTRCRRHKNGLRLGVSKVRRFFQRKCQAANEQACRAIDRLRCRINVQATSHEENEAPAVVFAEPNLFGEHRLARRQYVSRTVGISQNISAYINTKLF